MTTVVEEIPAHMKMADGQDLPEGFAMLSIPDATGDTRLMWNPRDAEDTALAKKAFKDARKRGMMVYLVDPNSGESTGQVVTEFPETEGKLIAVKPIQGG